MPSRDYQILESVTQLHDIARLIEEKFDDYYLSKVLRNCADRLAALEIHNRSAEKETDKIINHLKK
jgi:hypothetical protein